MGIIQVSYEFYQRGKSVSCGIVWTKWKGDMMKEQLVSGFSHLAFNVSDMEKALNFYCGILGLKKMYEMIVPENIGDLFPGQPIADMAGKPDLVYLQISPGVLLELFYPKPGTDLNSGGPNYEKIGYVHLSLLVKDIEQAAETLLQQGIELDSDITLGPDQTYQFWAKDPDGNRIEFMQYTDQSFQLIYKEAPK